MKPKELFVEAALSVAPFSNTAVVNSPERKRWEEAQEVFKRRTTELMDRAEAIEPLPMPPIMEFTAQSTFRKDGDLEIKVTKREVQLFDIPAGEEFDDLSGANGRVYKRITIGVHDLEFREYGGEWQPRIGAASCDIVTELHTGDDENPFDDFMVLERSNWQHPVYDDRESVVPISISYLGGSLNEKTVANAAIRANQKGWEAVLGGMHASLDDFEIILAHF